MKLTEKLLYNSIALYHVNKQGWDMVKDLNNVLKKDDVTVDSLLKLSAEDFIKTNANEVMWTTQVGFGKEFVEEKVLAKELIERLQSNGSLLGKVKIRNMNGKVVDFPVQGAKIRMVKTSETLNAPTGGATDTAQIKKAGTA